MMVKVDVITTLASMMHVAGLDYHELHLTGEKLSNNFPHHKVKWIVCIMRTFCLPDVYICLCILGIYQITLNTSMQMYEFII